MALTIFYVQAPFLFQSTHICADCACMKCEVHEILAPKVNLLSKAMHNDDCGDLFWQVSYIIKFIWLHILHRKESIPLSRALLCGLDSIHFIWDHTKSCMPEVAMMYCICLCVKSHKGSVGQICSLGCYYVPDFLKTLSFGK